MANAPRLLDRAFILDLLRQLDMELDARGVAARLFVIGKAAIVLAHGSEESTRDVDATLYPQEEVRSAADAVAARNGLPPDWLNDAAKMFLPMPDPEDPAKIGVFEGSRLSVAAASAEYLLAMKLRAGRRGRDEGDIGLLCAICGLSTSESAIASYESYYPEDPLKRSSVEILRLLFDDGT